MFLSCDDDCMRSGHKTEDLPNLFPLSSSLPSAFESDSIGRPQKCKLKEQKERVGRQKRRIPSLNLLPRYMPWPWQAASNGSSLSLSLSHTLSKEEANLIPPNSRNRLHISCSMFRQISVSHKRHAKDDANLNSVHSVSMPSGTNGYCLTSVFIAVKSIF